MAPAVVDSWLIDIYRHVFVFRVFDKNSNWISYDEFLVNSLVLILVEVQSQYNFSF